MPTTTLSKKRKVLNYLASGKSLTAAQAMSRFGVRNLRATMSDIRDQVERYGNWQIMTEMTSNGHVRYSMVDTHPGCRSYAYKPDGTRYLIG